MTKMNFVVLMLLSLLCCCDALGMARCEKAENCTDCDKKAQPGKPSVTSEGDKGFEASLPLGQTSSNSQTVKWRTDELGPGVTLASLVPPVSGVSSFSNGTRVQYKSATGLLDATQGQNELIVNCYEAAQLTPGPLNGQFDDMSSKTPSAVYNFMLGTGILQLLVAEEGGATYGYEMTKDTATGLRSWTDLSRGMRARASLAQPGPSVRVVLKEEYRKLLNSPDYELTSRTLDTYRDRGYGFMLEEAVIDPVWGDRPSAANLVTKTSYLDGGPVRVTEPNGSWSIESFLQAEELELNGEVVLVYNLVIPIINGEGQLELVDDPNFSADDGVTSVIYRGWLDAAYPSGIPTLNSCVAEVELEETGPGQSTIFVTEKVTQGIVTARSSRDSFEEIVDGLSVQRTITKRWRSADPSDYLTTEEWFYVSGTFAGRPYKQVAEDGISTQYDYAYGDVVQGSFVTTGPGFPYLRVRQWETPLSHSVSTRRSKIVGSDDRTVIEELEVWSATGSWQTMRTDRWEYNDAHPDGAETKHYINNILIRRSLKSSEREIVQEAGRPTTIRYGSGRLEMDYPSAMSDVVVLTAYDGRRQITTKSAGALTETIVTEHDVAGRLSKTVDPGGIATVINYVGLDRVTTRTGPGGVTEITTNYIDGQQKCISGSGVVPVFFAPAVAASGQVGVTRCDGSYDGNGLRALTEWFDWLGRTSTISSPSATPGVLKQVTSHYDPVSGRRVKVSSSAEGDKLLEYDSLGRVEMFGVDMNSTNAIELASNDRVTTREKGYVLDGGIWWEETLETKFYEHNNTQKSIVTARRKAVAPTPVAGGACWRSVTIKPGGRTETRRTVSGLGEGNEGGWSTTDLDLSETTVSPDETTNWKAGRKISTEKLGEGQIIRFEYDALGRLISKSSPQTGVSRAEYNAAGQAVCYVDGLGNRTQVEYYPSNHKNAGLEKRVTTPSGSTREYLFDDLQRVTEMRGSGAYRQTYSYTNYGDLYELTTFGGGGDPQVTRWVTDEASGTVTRKIYPDGNKVEFEYHVDGKVKKRTWQRGVSTLYSYDRARELIKINYSDDTPDISIERDRLGRPLDVDDGLGQVVYEYHPALGEQTLERFSADHQLLPGYSIESTWNEASGRESQRELVGAAISRVEAFSFDSAGRLLNISALGASHGYSYVPGTRVVKGLSYEGPQGELDESRNYDLNGRLYSVRVKRGENEEVHRRGYKFDGDGRKVRTTLGDGSTWRYSYNSRGEVIAGNKHVGSSNGPLGGGAMIAGMQFSYHYDDIGNRISRWSGGNEEGDYLRHESFEYDAANRVELALHPGTFDVLGRSDQQEVTVNAVQAGRQAYRFRSEVSVDNAQGPVYQHVAVSDGTSPTRNGYHRVPGAIVAPEYDSDGNLISDGRWHYRWDAENRLILVANECNGISFRAPGEPYTRLEFSYDWRGRRLRKQSFASPQATVPAGDFRFLYDKWNIVAEFSVVNGGFELIRENVWGIDHSGSEMGAGGIAGLLAVKQNGSLYLPTYDGGGNVAGWMDSTGAIVSRQEYDPFGDCILTEGIDIPFKFATKYLDPETGLLNYGYRYYSPSMGRWLSRDPIEERGGINLYSMVNNDPVNHIDILGLAHEGAITKHKVNECDIYFYIGHSVQGKPMEWDFPDKDEQNEDLRNKCYYAYALSCKPQENNSELPEETNPPSVPTHNEWLYAHASEETVNGMNQTGAAAAANLNTNLPEENNLLPQVLKNVFTDENRNAMVSKLCNECDCDCEAVTIRIRIQDEEEWDNDFEELAEWLQDNGYPGAEDAMDNHEDLKFTVNCKEYRDGKGKLTPVK